MLVSAGLPELTYELATRALEEQEGALRDLRSRAGTLLAAAALVATFLGSAALSDGAFELAEVVAILALFVTLGMCLWTLLPHTPAFAVDARAAYDDLAADADDVVRVHLRLAFALRDQRARNQSRIDQLYRVFAGGVIALPIQILAWAIALLPWDCGHGPDTQTSSANAAEAPAGVAEHLHSREARQQ